MFHEHQISKLKSFLKDHVRLKTSNEGKHQYIKLENSQEQIVFFSRVHSFTCGVFLFNNMQLFSLNINSYFFPALAVLSTFNLMIV